MLKSKHRATIKHICDVCQLIETSGNQQPRLLETPQKNKLC